MRWASILLMSVVVAGCGGGSRSADETARWWVEAVNEEDWNRACELSVKGSQDACVEAASEAFRDARGEMRIEGIYGGGERTTFGVTTPPLRNGGKEVNGWTAYGPTELAVERHSGEYLVRFEVATIR